MATKVKKRVHKMPPLSFIDSLIYWLGFLMLIVASFALVLLPIYLRHVIAFADSAVVAADDHISMFWMMVPLFTFFAMTFIPWYQLYQSRRPVFGIKNFKYGPPAWPKIYPLFMKNKPYVFISDRAKKSRKKIAVFLLGILLVSSIPFPWSLYGRDCLKRDGSIVQYNMFNVQTHDFAPRNFKEIRFETYHYKPSRYSATTHCGVQVVYTTESGKKYTFDHKMFRKDTPSDPRYWLAAMANIKRRYNPSVIRYEGIDDLDKVIADQKMTEEEQMLLYQLFEQR